MTLIILKKMTSKGFYLPRIFLFLHIGIGKLERTIFQKQYLSIKTAKMAKCQLGEELMRQTKPNTIFITIWKASIIFTKDNLDIY